MEIESSVESTLPSMCLDVLLTVSYMVACLHETGHWNTKHGEGNREHYIVELLLPPSHAKSKETVKEASSSFTFHNERLKVGKLRLPPGTGWIIGAARPQRKMKDMASVLVSQFVCSAALTWLLVIWAAFPCCP